MNEQHSQALERVQAPPEPQDTPETEAPETAAGPVRFVSRYPDLKLWMRQPTRQVVDGIVNLYPGKAIQFVNHEYLTSDPEEVAFLRSHRFYGFSFVEVTPEDLNPFRQAPLMQRGAATTRTVQVQGAKAVAKGLVQIACDFPGCTYIAEGRDEAEAKRKLNGHKTQKGHHVKTE